MKNNLNQNKQNLLHMYFLASAASYSDRCALSIGDESWSYAELEYEAKCWAKVLLTGCAHEIQRVGVFAYRNNIAYTGILATLFSGATYVPLNKTFPLERTLSMIRQASLEAVIVDADSLPQLLEILPELEKDIMILSPEVDYKKSLPNVFKFINESALLEYTPLKELPKKTGR